MGTPYSKFVIVDNNVLKFICEQVPDNLFNNDPWQVINRFQFVQASTRQFWKD